ncbi:MAG TPA: signal peptide peptidase SppA, partial [Bryobacteraceae bacterium]|nr:signal peptide peptidase SppA [Bryobacteraceae bacterium]
DRGIKGVILRIDSPGGDSFASDQIWHDVRLLAKQKPVVVSMSDSAASGGYYIAMCGGPVVAYPGTFTGSIGVFYGKANLRGLYNKLGITKEIISRGRFADIDSNYAPLTPAGREKLASIVQETYQTFLQRVADGRNMEVAQVEPVAQGRVWLGSQARENGLVDELGGIDAAVELVKEKAKIARSEQVRLIGYPARKSFLEWLTRRSSEPAGDILGKLRSISTAQWLRGSYFYLTPYILEVK